MKNILGLFLVCTFFSCQQDGSEISTDLVHNSNTASEGASAINPEDLPVIQFEEEFPEAIFLYIASEEMFNYKY